MQSRYCACAFRTIDRADDEHDDYDFEQNVRCIYIRYTYIILCSTESLMIRGITRDQLAV